MGLLKACVYAAETMQKFVLGIVELNYLLKMLNSILLIAALLLGPSSTTASNVTVEPQVLVAPVMTPALPLTPITLHILIDKVAAPNWNITKEAAWGFYNDGTLTIVELVPGIRYRLTLNNGIVDTVIDPSTGN